MFIYCNPFCIVHTLCLENCLTSLGECYTEQHHTGYYLLVELSIENTIETVCIIYKCILYTTNYGIFNTM